MWQPDGWGQTRIGVLTPHADIVPETEFKARSLLMEFRSTPRAFRLVATDRADQ
jgi:hypothetical protein